MVLVPLPQVFPSEQTLYTDEQLQAHDDEQHPQCVFCQRRFYSNDELYVHLSRDHFACHVCERLGAQHQYFNDWPALEVRVASLTPHSSSDTS